MLKVEIESLEFMATFRFGLPEILVRLNLDFSFGRRSRVFKNPTPEAYSARYGPISKMKRNCLPAQVAKMSIALIAIHVVAAMRFLTR
jgi:hypothetical protein